MMELACVSVIAFASLVSATPYGYGVKGGAAARADSSATSGTFGGYGEIPLSIPSGSSYSGSYSKSSSSSFAASSANSNSFSYSGTGSVPGYGANGNLKCSTGNCQTGSYGTTGLHGQVYTGANAATGSSAGAIVFPGAYGGYNAPCTSGSCSNNKPSCEGPNCKDGLSTDKKCPAGGCGSDTQAGTPVPGYGSDDIPVFVSGPESTSYNQKVANTGTACMYGNCGSSSNTKLPSVSSINKPTTYLITPKEDAPCTTPGCGSPGGDYIKDRPTSYNVPIHGGYSSSNNAPCTSGNCGNDQSNHPSTGPSALGNCASGNCAGTPTTSTPSKSPNYAKEDYPDFLPLADAGKTVTPSSGAPSQSKFPSYSHSASTNAPFANTGAVTGTAGAYSSSNPNSFISTTQKAPVYTGSFGGPPGILTPNNTPSKIPTSNYNPISPEGTSPISPHKPLDLTSSYSPTPIPSGSQYKPTSPSGSPSPICSFGNCDLSSQYDSNGSNKPTGSYGPSNPLGSHPTECSSGNCGSPSSPQLSGSNKPTGPTGSTHLTTPSESLTPTGCSNGNCGTQPSQSLPHYGASYKSSETSGSLYPPGPSGLYSPTGCSSGNCGSPSTSQHKPSNPYNPTGPTGLYNPTAPSGSYTPSPIQSPPHYGQSDINKPTVPAGSYHPSGSSSPTGCSSGNCGSQPSQLLSQYGQSGSQNPIGPSGSYHPPGLLPSPAPSGCSSGNCESPQGSSYKPSGPVWSDQPVSPPGSYSPTGCASENCGSQPGQSPPHYGQSSSYKPVIPTGAGSYNPVGSSGTYNPTGCSSGKCAPTHSTPQYTQSGNNNHYPTGCSSGNCAPTHSTPQYTQSGTNIQYNPSGSAPTQGFGGTGGILAPSGPTGVYTPVTCTASNCGSQPGHNNHNLPIGQFTPTGPAQGFGGPPGILKPNEFIPPSSIATAASKPTVPTSQAGISSIAPTGSYKPTCTSGNCAAHPGHSSSSHYGQSGTTDIHSAVGAAASANSVYSGGFGGPPGLLKPFDDGKLVIPSSFGGAGSPQGTSIGGPAPVSSIHSSYGKSLNEGSGANTGTAAQASAVSGSSAGVYGGNKVHGGDDNNISGGCKGGCGSDGGFGIHGGATKSVANAVSNASAGAYSGSFASSSASAHASAGAATKSSYGKR